jgi:hypothetical protein
MEKLITALSGRKTYIVAFVIAALNLAVAFDLVTVDQLEQINLVLVALGFGTIRAGISKS